MTATYQQAVDDILAAVKAAWDPTGHPMRWPDVAGDVPTSGSWARTTLRHVEGFQAAFGDAQRRFTRVGVLTVQVFCPRGTGLSSAYPLAKILADALEGKATPRGVWFRNVRINEVGPDGAFSQVNVLADFEYDEIK